MGTDLLMWKKMRLSNKMISLLILQNFYFIIIYFINNKYLRVISHLVKTSLERILSHFTHTHKHKRYHKHHHAHYLDITNTTNIGRTHEWIEYTSKRERFKGYVGIGLFTWGRLKRINVYYPYQQDISTF